MLTFFGFMHGEAVGIAVSPMVALAYAMVAAFLFGLSRMPAEARGPDAGSEGGSSRITHGGWGPGGLESGPMKSINRSR